MKINFNLIARWVLDKHKNPSPEGSSRAGVVSYENVIIVFTCADLNDVDFWECDIQNTFLHTSTAEKCFNFCSQ